MMENKNITPATEGSVEELAKHIGKLHEERKGEGKLPENATHTVENSSDETQEAYVKGRAGG